MTETIHLTYAGNLYDRKHVGCPEYGMTMAIWVRAFLQHDYGVLPSDFQLEDAFAPNTLEVYRH